MTPRIVRLGGLFDGQVRHPGPVDVHIDNDRVRTVAPAGRGTVDRDYSAAFCVPGLLDCHCHLACDRDADLDRRFSLDAGQLIAAARRNAAELLGTGVTTVADCGGRDEVVFRLRDEIAAGTTPGPSVYAAGRPVCRPGGHDMGIGEWVDGDVRPGEAVARRVRAGADFIKVMLTPGGGERGPRTYFDRAELTEIVRAAHAAGVRVTVHAHDPEGIACAIAGGVDGIEHATFLRDGVVADDPAARRELAASGIPVCPTNAVDYRKVAAGHPGAPREELIRSWRDTIAAGVTVVGGSDVGVPLMRYDDYPLVPELMVHELGLEPSAALRACTADAARYIRAEGAGVVEPGSRADLLIVAADPTEDISALRHPVAVLANGRWTEGRAG